MDLYDRLPAIYIHGKKKYREFDSDKLTEKQINAALAALLGEPGKSAGKAQQTLNSMSQSTSAYNSSQMDTYSEPTSDTGISWGSGIIGAITSLIGMAHADKAAKVAYDRQNEFYSNHLSMPAKVAEYEEAGLNPMGLVGAGAGATSAPSVVQGETPSLDSATSVLTALLNYKLGQRRADIEERRVAVEEEKLPSMIENYFASAENKRKQMEWYDSAISKMNMEVTQMAANVDKIFAETDKVSIESFLLSIQAGYLEPLLKSQLANNLKDLKVKDALITKYDADAAFAWAQANLSDITAAHQGALMDANTSAGLASAAASYATEAAKKYETDYMRKHGGATPPSGIIGAVYAISQSVASTLAGGVTRDPNDVRLK